MKICPRFVLVSGLPPIAERTSICWGNIGQKAPKKRSRQTLQLFQFEGLAALRGCSYTNRGRPPLMFWEPLYVTR